MGNNRWPSLAAAGPGGRTSKTVANSTACIPRRWGTAKQATTCREGKECLQSFHSGEPIRHFMSASKGLASLNYMDIKQILDRKVVENKKRYTDNGGNKTLGPRNS
jgi:hypothetical protein